MLITLVSSVLGAYLFSDSQEGVPGSPGVPGETAWWKY